jgi:hypothetical protein
LERPTLTRISVSEMQFEPPTTPTPPSQFLTADDDGLKRAAVVGNGPLSTPDRVAINNHTNVVRFNDYYHKNYVPGDKITMHCSTIDQFAHPWANPNATKWAVAAELRHLDADSKFYTWNMNPSQVRVYGTRFFWSVALGLEPVSILAPWFDTHRLFRNCFQCGDRCLSKSTNAGFSRGAIALNALEDDAGVAHIDVFGMNWNGQPGHVDFLYPTLVSECCTKCTIHPTHSMEYGGFDKRPMWQQTLKSRLKNYGAALAPLWVLLGVWVWTCLRRRRRARREKVVAKDDRLSEEEALSSGE